jgi:hypothetical protein
MANAAPAPTVREPKMRRRERTSAAIRHTFSPKFTGWSGHSDKLTTQIAGGNEADAIEEALEDVKSQPETAGCRANCPAPLFWNEKRGARLACSCGARENPVLSAGS